MLHPKKEIEGFCGGEIPLFSLRGNEIKRKVFGVLKAHLRIVKRNYILLDAKRFLKKTSAKNCFKAKNQNGRVFEPCLAVFTFSFSAGTRETVSDETLFVWLLF